MLKAEATVEQERFLQIRNKSHLGWEVGEREGSTKGDRSVWPGTREIVL